MAQETECEVCGEPAPKKGREAGELTLCEACGQLFAGSKTLRCC